MKAADKGLRQAINKATVEQGKPIWANAVNFRAVGNQDKQVLAVGATVRGGNPPHLLAATSRRHLSGGLVPAATWQPFEFGALNQEKVKNYTTRSRSGRSYNVTRHTSRQLPPRTPTGRVIYPAIAQAVPAIIRVWCDVIREAYVAATNGEVSGG